jgi:predicted transposase YbfD/YdcC
MPVKGNQPLLQAEIAHLLARAAESARLKSLTPAQQLAAQRVELGDLMGDRAFWPAHWPSLRTVSRREQRHGRTEARTLHVLQVPPRWPGLRWPGRQQIYVVQRDTILKKSGQRRSERVYGITSLDAQAADAALLLAATRAHWQIENGWHWVRDVTFDEDRCRARSQHLPQVLAAVRNLAIGLLRGQGARNIAAACRACAAQPWKALHLLGIPRTE